MKISNALTFVGLLLGAKGNAQSFVNGPLCDFELADITCTIDTRDGPNCTSIKTFDKGTCESDPDHTIKAVYYFAYSNKGTEPIRFFTEVNPDSNKIPKNDFTFARANLKVVNIQRGKLLQARETREFNATRLLRPCRAGGPSFRFVSEIQMNGIVIGTGNKGNNDYSCNGRSFFSHRIRAFTPIATPSPTIVPSNTLAPTTPSTSPAPTNAPPMSPNLTILASPTPVLSPSPFCNTATMLPTLSFKLAPTMMPSSCKPSEEPSFVPSNAPSSRPSAEPSSNPSEEPSVVPSNAPSSEASSNKPSEEPSAVPTNYAPSSPPSEYPSSTPSDPGFVLSDCASYSFQWLLDLNKTCRKDESGVLVDCVCKDAQERINTGEIQECGIDHQCPDYCAVCEICLATLTCP